jgi:hypothetical protein
MELLWCAAVGGAALVTAAIVVAVADSRMESELETSHGVGDQAAIRARCTRRKFVGIHVTQGAGLLVIAAIALN